MVALLYGRDARLIWTEWAAGNEPLAGVVTRPGLRSAPGTEIHDKLLQKAFRGSRNRVFWEESALGRRVETRPKSRRR